MLVRLVRIVRSGRDYTLKQIYVNPLQISYIQEDEDHKVKLKEHIVSLNLHESTGFSKIRLDNGGSFEEITVLGSPEMIHEKIQAKVTNSRKQLLRD